MRHRDRRLVRGLAFMALGWGGQLGLSWRLLPRGLRVLAYHAVHDEDHFRQQMDWVRRRFQPVGASQAIEVLRGTREMPRPIWVTFDDGDPSVVETALPILDEYGIRATLFVCPGLVDTTKPYWWEVVEAAAGFGVEIDGRLVTNPDVTRLKTQPDPVRRDWVARVQGETESQMGTALRRRQITLKQLQRWVRAGHTVGNHSWDHPVLDQTEAESQGDQIIRAHEWLKGRGLMSTRLFAYPNGNYTQLAMDLLTDLEYEFALLFDHRIAGADANFNVSRLIVNADDALPEYRARVTGAHTAAMTIFRKGRHLFTET